MELGEKLKAARMEAGLSQRQLCGDIITRNMLSQIENGSARPSRATLQALCARLGKPLSYFWEDAPSENLRLLYEASRLPASQALEILKGYLSPDPMLDLWYQWLCCRSYLELAEQALDKEHTGSAGEYLAQAKQQLVPSLQKNYLLLLWRLDNTKASALSALLPDNTQEQLLRAQAALDAGQSRQCLCHLDCADTRNATWYLLRSKALLAEKQYAQAAAALLELEALDAHKAYPLLELCYREMGNFEKAYYYACKQR